jgi:hypothetical protein
MLKALEDGDRIRLKVKICNREFTIDCAFHRNMDPSNILLEVIDDRDIRQLLTDRLMKDLRDIPVGKPKAITTQETYPWNKNNHVS